ncbi:MAG: VCBS repeat-containing protein [Verrucomicrobiales bacterium]|nr:VCBS repeat-containing protein [Verrucomicrobiales bacterium]
MNISFRKQTTLLSVRLMVLLILISHWLSGCEKKSAENNSTAKESRFPNQNELLTKAYLPDKGPRDAAIEVILRRTDAAADEGWDSEVVSDAAHQRLEELLDPEASLPEILVQPLRPPDLQESYTDKLLSVWRSRKGASSPKLPLSQALTSLRAIYPSGAEDKLKLKTYNITPSTSPEGMFTTEIIYFASGKTTHGTAQQNARWHCSWRSGNPPELLGIKLIDYEEILPKPGGGLNFHDITASVFKEAPSFQDQLMLGIDHWRSRLQGDFGIDVNGLQGISVGDANGDGLDDIYVCQQGGLPNKLYVRNLNGTLKDVSAESGVDWMELTRAVLFVDLDNDGDQDLALAQGWYWMLMENNGTGIFTKRTETKAPSNLHSLAAADYDLDGDLDLYFCGRNPARELNNSEGILGQPIPYHDANNGGANLLIRNDGDWHFSDATAECGLDVNNTRYSYACSWADFDLDGDSDLYVANDFGRNNLYLNHNGKFIDVAGSQGVEDMSAGMSITWGDYNNDGRPDPYISNMFSSAGNRITYQRKFRSGVEQEIEAFRRHARGNSLFANIGSGFTDVSENAAVTMARWAWGAKFVDLNNDGWEDIYVANGFITTEDTGDL